MEITMNFGFVNWFPVLGAAFGAFIIGGFWYSPMLFGKAWMNANGFKRESMKERNIALMFVLAFVAHWLSASLLAAVLGPNATAIYGLQVGLLVGAFFTTTSVAVTYIFENRGTKLLLINGGYYIATYAFMGYMLGFIMQY